MSKFNKAERLNNIKPSPTIAVTTKAAELKAAGVDVIGLGAGEPDFDTPEHIKQAAYEAIKQGKTKYTAVGGTPALKEAICNKFSHDNNISYQPENIVVGTGAKQVIFNAMLASLNKGDEVIIPAPYWVSYPDIVAFADGVPVIANCSAADNFKLTAENLEQHITPKTRWLFLNSPSNPTGAAYHADELEDLAKILRKYPNIWILSDDIYEHLVYDDFKFATIAEIAPDLQERVLTINGVSKGYSMTGWRIGYGAGNADLIKAMAMIQSQSTSNPCSISQEATIAALNGNHDFLDEFKAAFKNRRDNVVEKLNNINGIKAIKPNGAFYIFADFSELKGKKTSKGNEINNSNEFASYLLEYGVAVVPGGAFGADDYFRISYATSDDALEKACERVAKACSELK